ncbi:glycosyltransferase family 2 protein [Metabacillus sp. cB07]|uniref:glycosyltransferase family 2 protein n=1 Tax=Metabacillus sp. cB07 TaxID=2806989 RepID=UPI00193A9A36|nr:glycosyltransferase family 2 protein [Metabacillus sp. cB07]
MNNSGLTSIIILTHNGLSYTKKCLASLMEHTPEKIEIIVVDNASSDGTIAYLESLSGIILIKNNENKGFPAGCNQGLNKAAGEYIVLLNNDTVVTKEWLKRLKWCLDHQPQAGIAGPRSNLVLPHQAVRQVPYHSMEQMHNFANEFSQKNNQQGFQASHLSGLCMIFKHSLVEAIGGFDERFSPGYFEDTDFSLRARIYGKKLWVANDVFIHHYGNSSFKTNRTLQIKTVKNSEKQFKEKWNIQDLSKIARTADREKPFNPERHYVPF